MPASLWLLLETLVHAEVVHAWLLGQGTVSVGVYAAAGAFCGLRN